jgi:phage baseplate assembly protein W|tara:strand:+ start:108 stop:521 length:414 start_codon:yes stop_codon:yes gene_type:complete
MAQFNSKNKASRTARRWFTDMDINMTLHPESKDMVLKYDMQSVARSIKNLMQTNHYERPFAPSLGLNLRAKLFELDMAQTRVLENEIKALINEYEPRASVRTVMASSRGHELNVLLQYTIGNSSEPHSLDIILERIR